MYTIRDLCRVSNLSRSTILYYDSLGLLKPAERSASNYRLYSEESISTLKKICLYREAGINLDDIGRLVNTPDHDNITITILEHTLMRLNNHIQELREKQGVIVNMIKATRNRDDTTLVYDDQHFDHLEAKLAAFAFDVYQYIYGEETPI